MLFDKKYSVCNYYFNALSTLLAKTASTLSPAEWDMACR